MNKKEEKLVISNFVELPNQKDNLVRNLELLKLLKQIYSQIKIFVKIII